MQARMDGFDRDRLERTRLTLRAVRAHADKLWRLRLSRRQKHIGLPSNRADVMLMGVLIYEAVMEEFAFSELRVSTRGLRFAAALDGV
jgi:exopolyphosphatase/pppGpp-phosphohydrolase